MPQRGRTQEYIYGINPVNEALLGRREITGLWYRSDRQRDDRVGKLVRSAVARGIPVREADQQKLSSLSQDGNHQGIVLEVGPFPYAKLEEIIGAADGRPILVLDRVQDPQNLATLIRTAAAVDIAGVVIQTDRSASVTPAVVRSSAGLVEHLLIAREHNTRRSLDSLKEHGYWAVALEATEGSVDIFAADIPWPTALVVGSEASGISRAVLKACDLTTGLPMPGRAESLNAAVAGSVALFELLRRRMLDG